MDAGDAYASACRGDFRASMRLLSHRDLDPDWRAALRAQLWHVNPDAGSLLAPTSQSPAASLACTEAARAAFLAWDASAHARLTHRQLEICGAETALAVLRTRAFDAILRGHFDDARELSIALRDAAAIERDATLVLEAAIARGLAELEAGAIDEARTHIRRAARMSRTEGIPQAQYLANLVLARLRRFEHRPHLALHILTALSRAATHAYSAWISWEAIVAGGLEGLARVSRDGPMTAHLRELVAAGSSGDRQRFDAVRTRIEDAVPIAGRDHRVLATAMDASIDPGDADPSMHAWLCGEVERPPFGVAGLTALEGDAHGVSAYVAAAPGRAARRVLAPGAPLAGPILRSDRPGRLELGACELLFAGSAGTSREAFFRSVYRFEFVSHLHQGTLDTLLYRVRELVAPHAELVRSEGHVALLVNAPLCVADPRSVRSVEDQVLSTLAQQRGTAKDLAQRSGVPLRTVQGALRQLSEDGACSVAREGRNVEYVVEDTTFSEPTVPEYAMEERAAEC